MKDLFELSKQELRKINGGTINDDQILIDDPGQPPINDGDDQNKAFQLPGRGDN